MVSESLTPVALLLTGAEGADFPRAGADLPVAARRRLSGHRAQRHRATEVEALAVVQADLPAGLVNACVLDELGNRLQAHDPRDVADCLDHCPVHLVVANVANELA